MLKAVIFDMDGVLIDSEPIISMVEHDMYDEFGITVSKEEHLSLVGLTSRAFWSEIKNNHGLHQTVDEMMKTAKARLLDYIINKIKLEAIPGVVNLIEDLNKNNIRTMLGSSGSLERVNVVVKLLDLEKYLKERVSGDDVVNGKPDPEIFLKVATMASVDPKDCLVIEDSTNGLRAAKAAGMKCIGFNADKGRQDMSLADLVIDGFSEINVEKMNKIFEV